jgi:hypothetical protein
MSRRSLLGALVLVLILGVPACGTGPDPAPGAPDGRSAREDGGAVTPPQLAQDFAPELSAATEDLLASYEGTVRAVIRIAVRQDGTAAEARVLSAEPADLPAARGFAEDVARALRTSRYRPASRGGRPVDAEFDFAIEATGGGGAEEPPR